MARLPPSIRVLFPRASLPLWLIIALQTILRVIERGGDIEFAWGKIPMIGEALRHAYEFTTDEPLGALVIPAMFFLILWLMVRDSISAIAREEAQRGSRGGHLRPVGGVHSMVLRKQTEPGIRRLEFDAEGMRHWVGEGGKKVKAIRLIDPVEMLVKPEDCPYEVPLKSSCGDRVSRFFRPMPHPAIIVHEFGQLGVLIEEKRVGQRKIAVDLYFEES